MKSRITIDVDHDNQPVVKIEYSPSEDVRDKLVKKFLESYGGSSRWAEFFFINDAQVLSQAIHGQANSTALVRPLSIFQLSGQLDNINYAVEENKKMWAIIPAENKVESKIDNPLKAPLLHDLVDCLAQLKFGRPVAAQEFLDRCIAEANAIWPKGSTTTNTFHVNTLTNEEK